MGCGNLLEIEKQAQLVGKTCARCPYFPLFQCRFYLEKEVDDEFFPFKNLLSAIVLVI